MILIIIRNFSLATCDEFAFDNHSHLSETFKTGLTSDPFIVTRPVEKELITNLYELDSVDLNKTKDVRYGNGKCSPDLRLFENNISFINHH